MNILVINGDCVQVNSSANLCHLAYVRGLVDAGHDVTLLCAGGKYYTLDPSMTIPNSVKVVTYSGITLYERISLLKKKLKGSSQTKSQSFVSAPSSNGGARQGFMRKIKDFVLSGYGPYTIYTSFYKRAKKFRSEAKFDYVISIATPPISHLLANTLLKSKHISADKWIQIWEDPWYSDVYGTSSQKMIMNEERKLLSYAQNICYVSPLSLKNQQKLYPESADKMYWQPLPYYYKNESASETDFSKLHYGYFGDYSPEARNLEPFYRAAVEAKADVDICGNPYHLFPPTDKIHISPRLPLNELKPLEDRSNVLVFLCNRAGGQIPGKIYQYSATKKIILFIMDGTDEERRVLHEYFAPFNRYVFCENCKDSILSAMRKIESGDLGYVKNEAVEAFNPENTIDKILKCGM